ncbi:MAG: diguanylate cyclase [Christensenellaceae bacterium]|jgi:diguanylate cyclase (GGDEF)-like protein|nr:diguanylate cyclase [Christensenellaceae bacterium]
MKKDASTFQKNCVELAYDVIQHSQNIILRISRVNDIRRILFVGGNLAGIGYNAADFFAGKVKWSDLIHPDDVGTTYRLSHLYENSIDSYSLQYRVRKANGEYKWVSDYTVVTRDANGTIIFADNYISDYTEMKESYDKISYHTRWQDVFQDVLLALREKDIELSLSIILARAGEYLNITRIILVENQLNDVNAGKILKEWHSVNSNITKHMPYDISDYKILPEIDENLKKDGYCVIEYTTASKPLKIFLDKLNSKGLIICAVYMGNNIYGVIIFDDSDSNRKWFLQDVKFCEMIAHFISEIFTQKINEESRARSELIMHTILNNIPSYVYVIDVEDKNLFFANDAYIKDFSNAEIGSSHRSMLREAISKELAENYSSKKPTAFFNVELPKLGKRLGVHSNTITWVDGSQKILFTCVDLSEKWQHDQFVERIAYYDHLTGLGNRYNCDIIITDVVEEAVKTKQTGYVLFLDLDNFKYVNDKYGHDFGDALLIAFANFIKAEVTPESSSVFRFGGDEFVALVPACKEKDLKIILDKILDRVKKPWFIKNKSFICTLSIGVAEYPKFGRSYKELLKKADIAMYEAKRTGKNGYCFYSKQLPDVSYEFSRLETLMRRDIDANFRGFEVCYVVNGTEDIPTKASALLSWTHEAGNVMYYDDFISAAEYMGLIFPIGDFMLKKALEMLKKINDEYSSDFKMSIPITLKQLQNTDFPTRFEKIISNLKVDTKNIIFELGNGRDVNECIHMLYVGEQIKNLGASVVIYGDAKMAMVIPQYVTVNKEKDSSDFVVMNSNLTEMFFKKKSNNRSKQEK